MRQAGALGRYQSGNLEFETRLQSALSQHILDEPEQIHLQRLPPLS